MLLIQRCPLLPDTVICGSIIDHASSLQTRTLCGGGFFDWYRSRESGQHGRLLRRTCCAAVRVCPLRTYEASIGHPFIRLSVGHVARLRHTNHPRQAPLCTLERIRERMRISSDCRTIFWQHIPIRRHRLWFAQQSVGAGTGRCLNPWRACNLGDCEGELSFPSGESCILSADFGRIR